MKVEPITLSGDAVELTPLAVQHAQDLAHAAEPALFRYLGHVPPSWDLGGFQHYIARATDSKERLAFAIVERRSGRAIGSTSFLDLRPAHRGLEVGHTWIARAAQGTRVNPEAKLLLLQHAFETLGCVRVQLKTDARNEQSQRAMAKLGCVREGVLRRHMILPDGFVRDTVMFSITDLEWPAVRDALRLRLAALA